MITYIKSHIPRQKNIRYEVVKLNQLYFPGVRLYMETVRTSLLYRPIMGALKLLFVSVEEFCLLLILFFMMFFKCFGLDSYHTKLNIHRQEISN